MPCPSYHCKYYLSVKSSSNKFARADRGKNDDGGLNQSTRICITEKTMSVNVRSGDAGRRERGSKYTKNPNELHRFSLMQCRHAL